MKRLVASLTALFAVSALTIGVAVPVYADVQPVDDAGSALSDVTNGPGAADTDVLARLADVSTDTIGAAAIDATVAGIDVTVPTDPSDPITLESRSGTSISIDLPFANAASDATVVADGVVAYDNNNGSTTAPVVKDDGSVQLTTIIDSAAAPTTYAYPVGVPAGGSLVLDPKDGIVSVLDADGSWIAGIAPAWAKDANGVSLETSYSISGNTLVQTVATGGDGVAFPVVADPWLGIALIDHTSWVNTWQYSPTLAIFPTWWGRFGAGAAANGAAWSETLSKTSTAGHPNPNTAAMQVQFDCHYQVVRLKAPNKPSWNLDSKLPWTDFVAEVRYGCNYPTGNREF